MPSSVESAGPSAAIERVPAGLGRRRPRVEQNGEEGCQLGEDELVAVSDGLGDVGGDRLRHLGQVVVREPAAHHVHDRVVEPRHDAAGRFVVLLEELPGSLGEHLAADGGARGLGGPDGERTPGRILAGAAVTQGDREVVVALGDEEVPQDRVLRVRDLRHRHRARRPRHATSVVRSAHPGPGSDVLGG